jgi:hypothetical protein
MGDEDNELSAGLNVQRKVITAIKWVDFIILIT